MTESEWVTPLDYIVGLSGPNGLTGRVLWRGVFLSVKDGVLEVYQPQKPTTISVERKSRDNYLVAVYAPGCWTRCVVGSDS